MTRRLLWAVGVDHQSLMGGWHQSLMAAAHARAALALAVLCVAQGAAPGPSQVSKAAPRLRGPPCRCRMRRLHPGPLGAVVAEAGLGFPAHQPRLRLLSLTKDPDEAPLPAPARAAADDCAEVAVGLTGADALGGALAVVRC